MDLVSKLSLLNSRSLLPRCSRPSPHHINTGPEGYALMHDDAGVGNTCTRCGPHCSECEVCLAQSCPLGLDKEAANWLSVMVSSLVVFGCFKNMIPTRKVVACSICGVPC